MLYKDITDDRSQTMFAYRIKFWPWVNLSETARKLVRKHVIVTASTQSVENELMATEDGCYLLRGEHMYKVVWAFNCVPTKTEWKQHGEESLVTVEFRESAAIPERRVAILRFKRS